MDGSRRCKWFRRFARRASGWEHGPWLFPFRPSLEISASVLKTWTAVITLTSSEVRLRNRWLGSILFAWQRREVTYDFVPLSVLRSDTAGPRRSSSLRVMSTTTPFRRSPDPRGRSAFHEGDFQNLFSG